MRPAGFMLIFTVKESMKPTIVRDTLKLALKTNKTSNYLSVHLFQ